MTDAEPFRLRIEPGKVREFARATGSRHPEHHDWDHPVAPLTFLQAAAFYQTRANIPLDPNRDIRRELHAEQEFVFPNGPPVAGTQVYVGQARIDKQWTKEGRRGGQLHFTLMVIDYTDEAGDLVAQVRNTSVITAKPTGAG